MIKLNLGCGPTNFGDEWVHIDSGDYDHLDLKFNSITNLRWESNSVDVIYSSHVLEYFDRQEVLEILSEWERVLKKGGTLRLAVPDFDVMSRLYQDGEYPLDRFLGPLYGKMKMSDKTIYHKTVYDFDSISKILSEQIGFNSVKRYNWRDTDHSHIDDCSQAYLPHMDKDNGTLISLNVECKKS
jgi:predicted SAM-dependent methyltransferase